MNTKEIFSLALNLQSPWYIKEITLEKDESQAFGIEFAKTVKAYWSGIINYIKSKITTGVIEGINNKIQLAKRRARGFRNIENFIYMIYFLCGKLKFDYPLFPL